MAEIGNTRLTYCRYREPFEHTVPQRLRTTSHWSKPHRIRMKPHVRRVYPFMAEQLLDMYPTRIHATRLWPDYSTTSPHPHTHAQRARTRAISRGGALFVLSSRSSFSGAVSQSFSRAIFVDRHDIAVSTPTQKAQKRIYADGSDIYDRLPGHGHGTTRAKYSNAPFQMPQEDLFVATCLTTPREMI